MCSMLGRLRALALFGITVSASAAEVHPLAFRPILCWWSDTAQPIATEINLSAVKENQNQFQLDKVWEKDGWIGTNDLGTKDDTGFLKYRVVSDKADLIEYLVAENGGGSLTMLTKIIGKRGKRKLIVDGKEKEIVVLTISEVSLVKGK